MNIHAPGAFGLDFFYKQAAIMPCSYKEPIPVRPANNSRLRKVLLTGVFINDLR